MISAPPDEALRELIARSTGEEVVALQRWSYRYATSAPLEEVRAQLASGAAHDLILKDLAREHRLAAARHAKPAFLDEPRREVATYREILAPATLGPRFHGRLGAWLAIEKVPGVELWQVGDPAIWAAVAAWLGTFHRRFAGRAEDLRAANPWLLEHDAAWFRRWEDRARRALSRATDPRARRLLAALDRLGEPTAALAGLPVTLVHGELYPSNVLVEVGPEPPRVCPVDWEMAAVGPGLEDLVALVSGWGRSEQALLVAAYAATAGEVPAAADLDRCRLHLALQWLGWALGWRAPAEHAHDWLGEALAAARRLEAA